MKTSEQINDVVTALAKARGAFAPITRTKTVQVKGERGSYTFAYAPLEDILSAVTDALSAQALVLVGGTEYAPDGSLVVISRLCHSSGQWLECAVNVGRYVDERGKVQLQPTGSGLTYGRRYSISTLLALAVDDDDDGNAAEGNTITSTTTRHKTAAPDTAHATGMSPLLVGEDAAPGAATPPATNGHPTLAHLEALTQLVTVQCGADVEELDGRIRHTLGLRQDASTAPRLMVRVMSMAQYMTIFQHFMKVAAQLATSKGKETATDGTTPTPLPVPHPAPAATGEGTPASPSPDASSSAASDPTDAGERDQARLRAEVASWNLRISDQEREHVILHNPYSKARALLWKTRVDAPTATPIEAAAD